MVVRPAIVTESFPPDVNGVAHSVLRVATHLARRGHQPFVIAPQPAGRAGPADAALPFPVTRVPSLPLPGYPGFRLGLAGRRLRAALAAHRADVVHLASPFFLGAQGSAAAARLGLPSVAVYQTDVPGYARVYRTGRAGEEAAWYWLRRIHGQAARTLAPSTATAATLLAQGIGRVWLWGRGVDTERFHPGRRSAGLRAALAPGGEVIAGYVGRVAAEKRLDLLAGVAALPGVRLVIVGGGPAEAAARRLLPGAVFLGPRHGDELADLYASFDLFVHAGPHETFGQTLQEAAASGLPVVAPAAGGPLDIVAGGVTGFLVPPGDSAALAAAAARLAAGPALRRAQGSAARHRVLSRSWAALGDELIGHYREVLGLPAGHRRPGAAVTAGPAAGRRRDKVRVRT
jgi:phosphatidylinositol alpha 1,6-mannosyltransferase